MTTDLALWVVQTVPVKAESLPCSFVLLVLHQHLDVGKYDCFHDQLSSAIQTGLIGYKSSLYSALYLTFLQSGLDNVIYLFK